MAVHDLSTDARPACGRALRQPVPAWNVGAVGSWPGLVAFDASVGRRITTAAAAADGGSTPLRWDCAPRPRKSRGTARAISVPGIHRDSRRLSPAGDRAWAGRPRRATILATVGAVRERPLRPRVRGALPHPEQRLQRLRARLVPTLRPSVLVLSG